MVWSLRYKPRGSSTPNAEIVEGNTEDIELEDSSRDGGASLVISVSFSGRRAKPESVPKTIRWLSRQPLQDFENAFIKTVSDRFRQLIEKLEPGTHQFEPVTFIGKDGSHLGQRWFWQICNRLDSVHRDETNYVFDRILWRAPQDGEPSLVFDNEKIGAVSFWHDKHLTTTFASDQAKIALEDQSMSGIKFKHYPQS